MKELLAAFVKAQAHIEKATKDKSNPHFRSKYADLASVVDAIKPALEEHGLGFIQKFHDDEKAIKVETIIVHSSGEQYSCGILSIPVSKNDAQGFGSACTYARRYSLQAAFGVAPEDDDGNAAARSKQASEAKSRVDMAAIMNRIGSIADGQQFKAMIVHLEEIGGGLSDAETHQIKEALRERKAALAAQAAQTDTTKEETV